MKTYYSCALASLVMVSLSIVTSMSQPLTTPVKHKIPQRYTPPPQNAAVSRPGVRRASIYPQTITYGSLHKRMMPGFTPGLVQLKRVQFQTLIAMVPVTTPAKFLEEFFTSVALKADPKTGEWGTQLPRRDALDIIEGPFRLSLAAVGDTIPWEFVKDLAMRLWQCAALGVATLFEATYMDDAAKIAVRVSLTLLDESSVASGSGSGSGSGSDPGSWREGSWESITSPGGGS